MRSLGAARIIPAMTRPASSSKIMLLEDRRGGETGTTPVRRFRLARLTVDGPASPAAKPFEYLEHPHD